MRINKIEISLYIVAYNIKKSKLLYVIYYKLKMNSPIIVLHDSTNYWTPHKARKKCFKKVIIVL